MRPAAKAGLVTLGYVAALAITLLVAAIQVADTSGPDPQGGVAAFGDSLMLLAVFGAAAIPATLAALFFLRPYPAFWLALSIASLAAASTAVSPRRSMPRHARPRPLLFLQNWPAFTALRILVAPLFTMLWLVSSLFAPKRSARVALVTASSSPFIIRPP